MNIGVLHPGEMGAGIASTFVSAGHRVAWLPEGRSDETAKRASVAGLQGAESLEEIVQTCALIVSICPPHAAIDVARQVMATHTTYNGIYLDANAISPATAAQVAAIVTGSGAQYLDGSIIGSPPPRGRPRFYLSGSDATAVAELLSAAGLDVIVLGAASTSASALKMTYAAWSKGSAALLLAIRATADHFEVEKDLIAEWERSQPDLVPQSERAVVSALTRGWRWVGEMEESAATFKQANVPDGFQRAAAEVYRRVPRKEPLGADTDLRTVLDDITR